jgi:stage IV sporulation protein FB
MIFSYLHEYSHGIVAAMLGYTPSQVSVGFFGGVLHLKERFIKPGAQLMIHSAGPLFNLGCAMFLYPILLKTQWMWVLQAIGVNLLLAFFNLLPLIPLDGGKIVGIYLARSMGYEKSYIISKTISIIFSIILFILGLYLVQYNVINVLISVLAVNLFIESKRDNRYSFNRLMEIYTILEGDKKYDFRNTTGKIAAKGRKTGTIYGK